MRKIFLPLFVFIIVLSHAQDYPRETEGVILKYTLYQTSLKTGDKGLIRIKVAETLTSSESGTLSIKNNEWFFIEDIKINHDENEILIWFIPLDPSISHFPDFTIQNKTYSGIPLSVKSQLGNLNTLNFLGGKILLPWTMLLFAAGFTLLVLVLVLIYFSIKVIPKKIRKSIILKNKTFRRKRLLKKMLKMCSRLSKYKIEDYIKRFIRLLKEYLEIATSKKTICFTTGEIITTFPHAPSKELIFMDSVRFGDAAANPDIITEASGAVYNFALMFEENKEDVMLKNTEEVPIEITGREKI